MTQKVKIYTKTGDRGETGLFGGSRVKKTDQRIVAIGSVDELNAVLGVAAVTSQYTSTLEHIQNELFNIGAELANPKKVGETLTVTEEKVTWLEEQIDEVDKTLIPLQQFILPGGNSSASALHWARTVCRRVEREVLKLADAEAVNPNLTRYLNRLSDLLFNLARGENAGEKSEKFWRKG